MVTAISTWASAAASATARPCPARRNVLGSPPFHEGVESQGLGRSVAIFGQKSSGRHTEGCDIRETQSRLPGFERLRHLRHSRHRARSRGLGRGCRRSRGGFARDFCQRRARINPHRPRPSRLPRPRPAQRPAPRFQPVAAQAIRVFRECPAPPEPSGFRVVRSARAAPPRAV